MLGGPSGLLIPYITFLILASFMGFLLYCLGLFILVPHFLPSYLLRPPHSIFKFALVPFNLRGVGFWVIVEGCGARSWGGLHLVTWSARKLAGFGPQSQL